MAPRLELEASNEVVQTNTWFDQWYKAKYGRNSPGRRGASQS